MNCANHPEAAAVAFCRTCGMPLCQVCQRPAQGTIFCAAHDPAAATANVPPAAGPAQQPAGFSPYVTPYTAGGPLGDTSVSPGLAFLLGLIPGVGAIYNGQYAKGLAHVAVFGLLISVMESGGAAGIEPLIGLLLAGFYFYMPFEAYHTARKRQRGEPVDEFSSLVPLKGSARGVPVGPIVLIVLGVLFLLNTLEIIRFYQIVKWWPVFLIVLGVYMLWARMSAGRAERVEVREAVDER